ncbi:hypothetical protein [Anoxybacillus flavithermus]|uniref:hypothetical protein n=1 Tax=Anoxybacillus flavithermus TaxID=33934 RepID=UPI0007D963D1|nr:hypothetical protein [Anoxybacillus flavithermus]MBE2904328.1 hypothetical protein [Anoxybacillus flavithermus]MBE2911936.1 hypothetical protein [Anoxybacillus flavithermus]MBE2928457.1 hypothetical protein [Anoxybacillus flavithermus]MBE2955675.1 hypothetical protein [Anoxybacillus flavithermus]
MPYLFFAIFFLILIPIYMRLPFGWTKKGVALLLAVACLLSMFGMIAIEQFPLWQASLFLFLLVIASTYLLERKLGHLFYVRIHEHDLIVEGDEKDEQENELPSAIEEVVEQQNEEIRQEEIENVDEEWFQREWPEEIEQQTSIEPLRENDFDHMIEPIESVDDVIEPLRMVDSDDTSVNETTEDVAEQQWLDLLSEENMEIIHDQNEMKEEKDSQLLDIETIAVVEETSEHMVDESYRIEPIVEDDDIHTEASADMVEEQESIQSVEEAVEQVSEEEQGTADDECVTVEENNEEVHMLPRPFMKNLLASLYAMRPLLSDEQYEQLIHKHLHPRLHEQDYYTFANVLMEHYVASKQYEKLYHFAKQLYGQYEPYPIIQQQLAHMIHYAEQKMGWKK